jgi:hypothetical protein
MVENNFSGEPRPPEAETPRVWQQVDFWIGFILFICLNGIFIILNKLLNLVPAYLGIFALAINIVLLAFTARKCPKVAIGFSNSFVIIFLTGLCWGVFIFLTTCFQYS